MRVQTWAPEVRGRQVYDPFPFFGKKNRISKKNIGLMILIQRIKKYVFQYRDHKLQGRGKFVPVLN
jgi:hypothetical protein